jgi:hypothetical protein
MRIVSFLCSLLPLAGGSAVLVGCQQTPPRQAAAASSARVDSVTDIDGTTIGTPASSIADLAPLGPLSAVSRALRKPRPVFGVTPDAAEYDIVDDAFAGGTWRLPASACDGVVSGLSGRIGAPERSGATFLWTGARLELHVTPTPIGCLVAYGTHAIFDPNASFGPHTSALPRFGTAELGAPFASFKDLVLRERDGHVAWYAPTVKRYGDFDLARLTYKFADDKLVNVGFETVDLKPCATILHDLQTSLGPSTRLPGLGGGTQDTWKGVGDTFTFKFNQSSQGCSGILFQGGDGFGP